MGGVDRKESKRKCVNGDIAARRKKKRRRKEGTSTSAAPTSTGPKQVDSSKPLVGSACAGLGKKKKRLKDSQTERHSYDLSGEASAEKEKQSLLAWVEKDMQPEDDGNTMNDSNGCSKIGQFVKDSAGRYSNGHGHTHRNGEPNRKQMYIASPITYNFVAVYEESSHSCDPEKESLTKDQCTHNEVSKTQGEVFPPCHAPISKRSSVNILSKEVNTQLCASGKNKRKREVVDKVLNYVMKRSVVVKTPSGAAKVKARTTRTVVIAWGRNIPVIVTSEACVVEEWISSHDGGLFGLDVEWRPNRLKGQRNKVALLQLSNEDECLIIQMLFLDRQPQALRKLLLDPSKGLAGVGVFADGKKLLQDYGLECQGGIELTTLAVERLKREELRNVGLKVLMLEVLGLALEKSKRVTLSNWAKEKLDQVQINYACMDAWASFALSKRLLVQT